MILIRLLLTIAGLFFFLHSSMAQKIDGQVIDSKTWKPISNASIILKKANGDVLTETSADENGRFKINQQKKGSYQLDIYSIGHQRKIFDIHVQSDTVINISLIPDILELAEVTITAEKTTTQQFMDKKVINVGKDLLSIGGNALTVFEQLPEIKTDINGNISLRGGKNVNVLVNGKPSPLSVTELLRQTPASNINKIEVITTPSSKYAANGLTGIINIITHKRVAAGLNVNSSVAANSIGGYSGNTNLSTGKEKLVYSFGLGYERNRFKNTSFQERTQTDPFKLENEFNFKGDTYRLNGGIDWFPDKSNEFTLKLNYVDDGHDMLNKGIIFQRDHLIPQDNVITHSHKTFDITTNYRHNFKRPENFIEFDLYTSNNLNLLKSSFLKNIGVSDNQTENGINISRASADYTAKLNSTFAIESGLLWERMRLNNSLSFLDQAIPGQINNQFQNIQSTYASYLLTRFYVNKLSIQAGLRGEMFRRDATLITDEKTIQSHYNDLFPSLHVGYNINEGKTISIGYNKRTSRPSLDQTNPNVVQPGRFEMNVGNVDLRPEFSNNFEADFQVRKSKFNFSAGLSYSLKTDVILDRIFINENGTNVYSPINGGKSSNVGLDISSDYQFFPWWTPNFSANWNYEKSRMAGVFFYRDFGVSYSFTFKNDFKISEKTNMGITWRYNGIEKSFLSNNDENQNISIAVQHKVLKNNGSLSFRFADVFNTQVFEGKTYGINFIEKYRYKPVSRAIFLSFTYNFKNGLKVTERNIKSRAYKSGLIH